MTDKDFYTTDAFAARAVDWIEKHKTLRGFSTSRSTPSMRRIRRRRSIWNALRTSATQGAATSTACSRRWTTPSASVLGKLRALKLEENTLIFFISDNGAPGGREGNGVLRGGKNTCWEGGSRLPWMMQWKGKLPAGKVYDLPVVQLDVMPTCLAAAGGTIDSAWKLDGVNLLPYLSGENKERPHQTLYWRIDGMWAIRDGDMKLVQGRANSSPPELFDLANDVGEKSNLAARQPEKFKELKAMWDDWNTQMAPPATPQDRTARKARKRAKRGLER